MTRGHVGKGTHERHRGSVDQNGAELVDRLIRWPVGQGDTFPGWAGGKLEVAICDFKGRGRADRLGRPYVRAGYFARLRMIHSA